MIREGSRVKHRSHGPGIVTHLHQDGSGDVDVLFDTDPKGWDNPLIVSTNMLEELNPEIKPIDKLRIVMEWMDLGGEVEVEGHKYGMGEDGLVYFVGTNEATGEKVLLQNWLDFNTTLKFIYSLSNEYIWQLAMQVALTKSKKKS